MADVTALLEVSPDRRTDREQESVARSERTGDGEPAEPDGPAAVRVVPEDSNDDEVDVMEIMEGTCRPKDAVDWAVSDHAEYVLERRKKIPFCNLRFDTTGSEGQARPMEFDLVKIRERDVENNPPDGPLEPIVWQETLGVCVCCIVCSLH
jgi:hypothetical protein